MSKKVYRTAQGKAVDLGALQLQNENIRAVGNMNVNARGDLIDGLNRPIKTRNQQVQKQYNRQITNVSDSPVVTATATKPVPRPPKETKVGKVKKTDIDTTEAMPDETMPKVISTAEPQPVSTGLAAAIAKARQIKQDLIETPSQINQSSGINKI